jgi:iron(III) transport system ATP-binding protein
MALSDRILVMNLGIVQQVGTPLEVYQRPANRFVFGFIGLSNFLEVRLDGGAAAPAGLPPPPAELTASGRAVLASRPTEIDFTTEGGVRAVVKRCAYLGEIIDYRLDVDGQEVRVQKGRRTAGPREGEACGLVFTRPTWYPAEENA